MLDERWAQSCDWLNTNINENNEKIINNEHEISKLIKALPKDIAALDKRFDKLLNEMLFL